MRKVVIGTHDEGLKRLKTTDVDEPQTVGSKEIKVQHKQILVHMVDVVVILQISIYFRHSH